MRRIVFYLLVISIVSSLSAEVTELFKFGELEGFTFSHTDLGKRPADGNGYLINPDKINSEVKILKEEDGEKDQYYISHNGGLTPVIPISGEFSLTFLESYGGNNFLWTVCLDEKNDDGSFMLIMTANLADGAFGIRTRVFRGKAYR